MSDASHSSASSIQGFKAALSAAKKDREEVHHLLDLCRPLLTLMARQSLGSSVRRRESDSDVVQITIIEALRDFPMFKGKTLQEFLAWLKRLHRHNINNLIRYHHAEKRDLRRDAKLQKASESDVSLSWYLTDRTLRPEVEIVKTEKALALSAAIEKLPDAQRTAITMRHIEGASLATICEAMNKTPASVAGLLRRGLATLRTELGNESSWS